MRGGMKQEKWRKLFNEELTNCDTSPDIAWAVQNVRLS
jgi:hypothetical protein